MNRLPAVRKHRVAWLTGLVLPVVLGACAVKPLPTPAPAVEPAAPVLPEVTPTAVPHYVTLQRTQAEAAAREGRWTDAVWAWDIVLALSPQDLAAQKGRQAAQAQVQTLAAERLAQARAARTRGQLDLASRLYLEVLAVAPGLLEAANALRAIERDRARRQAVGGFARAITPPGMTRPDAPTRTVAQRPDLEHASLLAGQGEVEAAIGLLLPAPGTSLRDPAARRLLADLYVKRADQLAASNRTAAVAALRQSLRWQPGHAAARERLKQLRAAPAAAAEPAQLPRAPVSRPSSALSSGR